MKNSLPVILVLLCMVSLILGIRKERQFVVSSYSANNMSDVRLMEFAHNGEPRLVSEIGVWNNPSYFTFDNDRSLYFINEVSSFGGREGGGITTMRKMKNELQLVIGSSLNQAGGGPCFVTLSDDKRLLITANYGSGSVSVVKLGVDGLPEKVTDTVFFAHPDSVQSHPHMVLFNPAKKVYYVTDLGLDRIFVFTLDNEEGKLVAAATPYVDVEKGNGPRHMVMDKKCRVLYVVNELSSTISVYDIRPEVPVLKQTISALPGDFKDKSYSGDICLAPSGKFLYVTNRGSNTIGVYRVQGESLTLAGHVSCGGNWPRNMAVNKSGKQMIVCNQKSGDLAFFKINRKTGMPEKEDYSYKLNAPSCVKFIE